MRFVSGVNFNTPCTGCLDASCGLLFFFFNVVVYSRNSKTLSKPIVILVAYSVVTKQNKYLAQCFWLIEFELFF